MKLSNKLEVEVRKAVNNCNDSSQQAQMVRKADNMLAYLKQQGK